MKLAVLATLAILATAVSVQAQPNCATAIRAAVRGTRAPVPEQCWRLGPLTLGMKPSAVKAILGSPDAAAPALAVRKGRKIPVRQEIYVYPRDLALQLKQHPLRPREFHPLSLRLTYYQDQLVAISVGGSTRTDFAPCTSPDDKSGLTGVTAAFPYNFYGIALGAPRDKMIATFGPFHSGNNSHDFWNYWPAVPLSIDGENTVNGLYFSSDMTFADIGGMVHYVAAQNLTTCRIHGFHIETDR